MLADAAVIVCANCGETPAAETGDDTLISEVMVRPLRPPVLSNVDLIDAVRRPLVTYTDGKSDAWAAKLQADRLPPPGHERRTGRTIAAAACVLLLTAFVGGRQAAVAAVPDLAGLYAMLGIPVNLYGLEINGVEAERRPARKGVGTVLVRGVIVNVSRQAQPIPPLAIGFRSGAAVGQAIQFDPPAQVVGVGAAAPFEAEVQAPSAAAADVVVRFASAPAGAAALLGPATLQ